MKVLCVTNQYPTELTPFEGSFIEQQVKGLRNIGIYVELLYLPRVAQGMKVYLSMGRKLSKFIKKNRPDIVHVMYGGVMAGITSRVIQNVPLVITLHGSDLLGEPHNNVLRRILARAGVWASHLAVKRADRVIVVAEKLSLQLKNRVRIEKISIIPNGIDLLRFKPMDKIKCRETIGWDMAHHHVLFPSSRSNKVKNYELARLTVSNINNNGGRVILHELNEVPNKSVPIWINASDGLLLTSHHEGSPTIVKEALACNTPIVSVDVGDVAERLNGIKGCYICRPDITDLSSKLVNILSHPTQIDGRSRMQDLTLEKTALKIRDVYRSVLN